MPRFNLKLLLCLVAFLLVDVSIAVAQTQPTDQSSVAMQQQTRLLRELIDEVRQLRLVLQISTLSQHRTMSLMDQINSQRARVQDISSELEYLRKQIREDSDTGRYDEELKEVEMTINETSDPVARSQLIQGYAGLKRSIERQKNQARQELERLQEHERNLENQLRIEQGKLTELQAQLDDLERELDRKMMAQKASRKE